MSVWCRVPPGEPLVSHHDSRIRFSNKTILFTPLRTGGFTTPTIYDVIISVVNSSPSVKNIISMSFARRHSFHLNGHNPQTTSPPTITTSSTISINMPATRQATNSRTANSAQKHSLRSMIIYRWYRAPGSGFSEGRSRLFPEPHHPHRYWRPPAF